MLQEITRSVTLTYHPFFKSLLAGFESLSLLNRCLTQLHLRNKVTADPSSSVQTPLKQNKNTPSQLPFSITLAFCGQKKNHSSQKCWTHPELWTSGTDAAVCQEIILNQALGERREPGHCECLHTHRQQHREPPRGVCLGRGLLEQAVCVLWPQGTRNGEGWDRAGCKSFEENYINSGTSSRGPRPPVAAPRIS